MLAVAAGQADLARAARELAARIPEPLAPLARIAYNYAWSWDPEAPSLFRRIDPERFELALQNPVRLLEEVSWRALERAAADEDLRERAAAVEERIQALMAREPDPAHGIDPERPVAFLCAAYGGHVSLPIYSGGLGALAGDIVKEASDLAVPMVAVGLMYRRGYFRQRIDAGGWQHEYWVDTDPERLPAALVTRDGEEPLRIVVPLGDGRLQARIWRVDVGRVPLFLLDTDFEGNDLLQRWITARLYEGDSDIRISQYKLLGIGGIRALRALGVEPGVVHLNEGHAALAPVELALGPGERNGRPLRDLLDHSRRRTVFTTHTPVPAGNDSYPREQIERALGGLAHEQDLDVAELVALGQTDPSDGGQPFGVTQAALRLSRAANAVSRRHGEVAREMWTSLWPGRTPDEVPIGHVTNGVHLPTWLGPAMRELLDRHLGQGWLTRAADPQTWEPVRRIPDEELWEVRQRQREQLIAFVSRRSMLERLGRADLRDYVRAAADGMRPETLTLGFARRVATYKRLDLLTRDAEWAISLLDGDRPVQLVLAGKAHPRDEEAKRVVQRLFGLKGARAVAQRVAYLDDYDLATAAALVRGCDVWLNLPRPPLEASGTSGMKSAVNGGLQLSVLDGWWAEAYDGSNGWAIPGEVLQDHEAQDARDAGVFHHLLADEVVPTFYERDDRGLPVRWIEMIRASIATLAPRFSATRMVRDYVNGPYRGS